MNITHREHIDININKVQYVFIYILTKTHINIKSVLIRLLFVCYRISICIVRALFGLSIFFVLFVRSYVYTINVDIEQNTHTHIKYTTAQNIYYNTFTFHIACGL